MMHYYGKFRLAWDLIIVIVLIINFILIPFEVAFTSPFDKDGLYIAF
jgi:hypothetical protein